MLRKVFAFTLALAGVLATSLTFGATPQPAQAQGAITLSQVVINLWPEYDKPAMLVFYDITLPSTVSLPVDLTFRIPASVGGPSAVAARQPNGDLLNLTYDNRVNGEWEEITLTATTPEIRLEYYDPSLIKEGDSRHFEYSWPGGYAVSALNVIVQEPTGATNMRFAPNLGPGVRDPKDNLVYYRAQVGALTEGQSFKITIDYQKSGDTLSAPSLPVSASGPIEDTASGLTLTSALPWILAGLGLLLIVGGGLWYWQSGREGRRPATRRKPETRRRKPSAAQREAGPAGAVTGDAIEPAVAAEPEEGEFVYCHQCGKRAGPNDRFCRACGAPLRSSG